MANKGGGTLLIPYAWLKPYKSSGHGIFARWYLTAVTQAGGDCCFVDIALQYMEPRALLWHDELNNSGVDGFDASINIADSSRRNLETTQFYI